MEGIADLSPQESSPSLVEAVAAARVGLLRFQMEPAPELLVAAEGWLLGRAVEEESWPSPRP